MCVTEVSFCALRGECTRSLSSRRNDDGISVFSFAQSTIQLAIQTLESARRGVFTENIIS